MRTIRIWGLGGLHLVELVQCLLGVEFDQVHHAEQVHQHAKAEHNACNGRAKEFNCANGNANAYERHKHDAKGFASGSEFGGHGIFLCCDDSIIAQKQKQGLMPLLVGQAFSALMKSAIAFNAVLFALVRLSASASLNARAWAM